jgi:hypothetical protein
VSEDKEQRVIQEIIRVAKEEVPFGSFKVTFRVHQGKICGMKEEHKERETTIA